MFGPVICAAPGAFYVGTLLLALVNPRNDFGLGMFMFAVGVTIMPFALLAAIIFSIACCRRDPRYKASLLASVSGIVSIGVVLVMAATHSSYAGHAGP